MEHYKYHIILSLMAEEKQTDKISYFVTAFIHKVKINKNVAFKSKVMWKRSNKKNHLGEVKT
jgi:hypothetical protein